ncbi:MAG: hypothetical protein KJ064_01785 [Anaerolineae bacterium]|nr:hypothetical protein [Anaerolineae bacterium]
MTPSARLIEIDYPDFGTAAPPARPDANEYESRLRAARAAMDDRNLTHLVVYADREHFANLAYLTGFEPRFEESLLILGPRDTALLIVGNECEGYLPISPLWAANKLRHERFQPFSLLNQPREHSRMLKAIFLDEGIKRQSKIGCVGWKYFTASEHHAHAIDLPAYIVDTLRELAESVTNVTDIFMHPGHGLRTFCSPADIAYFEYTNILASESIKTMLFGVRDGMTDYELGQLAAYPGEPLGCHWTLAAGQNTPGLAGPSGKIIRRGEALSANVCYWGANICRAGWVADTEKDLPLAAQDYVENFAGLYFQVMNEWFSLLTIGTPGGVLARLIADKLPYDKFGIFLNAGHLIHLDEWVSSPIFPGSDLPLHSGMAMQVDVIPSSPVYFSTRMEDGVVLADASLREQIQTRYPDCYHRMQQRRRFMIDTLGMEVPEDVLPLSNIPAIVPPFFLVPNRVFAL